MSTPVISVAFDPPINNGEWVEFNVNEDYEGKWKEYDGKSALVLGSYILLNVTAVDEKAIDIDQQTVYTLRCENETLQYNSSEDPKVQLRYQAY